MPIKDATLQKLQQLRKELHQEPEVSGEEKETAQKIRDFITQFEPDEVVTGIGGEGMIFYFDGEKPGPTVMIRAELDGLPIEEINDIPYKSRKEGKAHLCGHDGHMSMVAGLAPLLADQKPDKGRVALLFQPAEETGEGAGRMIKDDAFQDLKVDYIFALHNLPGFAKKDIIVKEGVFAAASKGLIIELQGKTSHAAEPHNGISPARAVAEIIKLIEEAPSTLSGLKDFALATVVHARLGDRAFGVTPGKGVVMATIRAYHDEDLSKLEKEIEKRTKAIAEQYKLKVQISDTEIFSSTISDKNCCEYIKNAAQQLNLSVTEVEQPFRWSEDFGLFTQKYKGALFGLGSGEDMPDLHNPNYNFPDEILSTGILMFYNIINQLLKTENA
ncbi:amidohydrolase [Fulvivirga kasyanovii]|uniref:Amidohydrolase n=1 Tax=Fulvivirga kasyanovii TaxID=396812 RepID=A0ABW9RK17_9BACT|nr:amidohydrolase [Fulvivirga kasyanovii]MTI24011.1 amidohydrolase [Fulvivirga kasyanovii]